MKRLYAAFVILALPLAAFSQVATSGQGRPQSTPIRCASMELYEQQVAADPFRAMALQQVEQQMQQWIATHGNQRGGMMTIPVVVHVIHNGQAVGSGSNISDAQVLSQIDVLNEDFRRQNSDAGNTPSAFQSIAADCEIEFCLASIDPNGQPTTGIVRWNRNAMGWSAAPYGISYIDGTIKPATIWNRNNYLNLWTVDFGGGLLGYAQFPGGPANTDGVVCGYQYFGRYPQNPNINAFNLGRTATHEVGHWLNLYHIWGDDGTACSGSDLVGDTPNQADEHYGCPSFPQVSCSNGPNGDMFMNYMDYSDDDCMNLFTTGQRTRMRAALSTTRASILSSQACTPPPSFAYTGKVIDASTGTPLFKAQVRFSGQSFNLTTQTDVNGDFAIPQFFEDTYDIYAAIWGHQTKLIANVFIDSFSSPMTIALDSGYYDDFVLDLGWTKSNTATTGLWTRGTPVGTTYNSAPVNPGTDVAGDYSTECYVTGNGGGQAGTDDIDGGTVTLVSPAMDLTGYMEPYISFYRWFQNTGGTGTPNDQLLITISNGTVSDTLDFANSASPNLGQWVYRDVRVLDYVPLSANVTVTLVSGDLGAGHLVEAALDWFYVYDSLVGTQVPQAIFTANNTAICEGASVSFSDQSTNGPNTLSWSFPGGTPSSSSSANPTVTYSAQGTYDVTLMVTNQGGSDTLTLTGFITVNDKPDVSVLGTNILCNGEQTGVATAVVTGGTPLFQFNWTTQDSTATVTGLGAGFYNVTVTDANGCTDVATVQITQPPAIAATGSSTPEHGTAQDGSASVNASGGVPPYTYSWSNSATTQTITGLSAGVYSLTITDANGCAKTFQVTVDRVTAVSEPHPSAWIVYPNPSDGLVHVETDEPAGASIFVYDLLGREISRVAEHTGGVFTLDLSTHPPGIYTMTIESHNRSKTLKLSIKR